jgi:hypothetical protein
MPKFTTPSLEPELSPAHHRLADLQRQLDEAQSRVDQQHALAARLDAVHAAVGPARAELAAHDAQDAIGMANWARGLVNSKSTSDASQREMLARVLADAEQSSAAAAVAQQKFHEQAVAESAPMPRLRIEIDEARRLVLLDDATAIFSPIADAIATAVRLHNDLDAARNAAMTGIEFGAGRYTDLYAALGKFDAARERAEARPVDPAPEDRTIPGAQMAAEVRAIMSFPSTSASPVR